MAKGSEFGGDSSEVRARGLATPQGLAPLRLPGDQLRALSRSGDRSGVTPAQEIGENDRAWDGLDPRSEGGLRRAEGRT